MIKLKMKNYNNDLNREAAKMSASSSGKIDKHEYLTGEEILPSNQQQIIEQAKLTYSPLGKAFEKQTKTIEDQGQKQVEALNTLKSKSQLTIEDVIPKDALNNDEAKKELNKIKEIEKKCRQWKISLQNKWIYIYSFEKFQTIKTFGGDIYNGSITLKEANDCQTDLLIKIMNFREKKPKKPRKKTRKRNCS